MEYFDFIKPGDLDNLPEDPQLRFARIVEIAQPRLAERLLELDANDREGWALVQDARYGFQNLVMGAARQFKIEPFASRETPLFVDYDDKDYRQFRHDLTSYIAQIMFHAADHDRANSVPLVEERRQTIRTYIFHLREAIDKADLPEKTKERLHKRLDTLEQELTRKRLRVHVMASILMGVIAVTADLGGATDTIAKVVTFIMREIGQAKEADEEQRQVSYDPPIALAPPKRPAISKSKSARDELDDEIPF